MHVGVCTVGRTVVLDYDSQTPVWIEGESPGACPVRAREANSDTQKFIEAEMRMMSGLASGDSIMQVCMCTRACIHVAHRGASRDSLHERGRRLSGLVRVLFAFV